MKYEISDELWAQMEPLIPKPIDNHPLGMHRPRVPNRSAMNAILFVLKTGCQWEALDATGICKHSSAHRRFQEWTKAGVFEEFWKRGLFQYDDVKGINWKWLSLDGAITKSPLGGEKNRQESRRQKQNRSEKKSAHRSERNSARNRS